MNKSMITSLCFGRAWHGDEQLLALAIIAIIVYLLMGIINVIEVNATSINAIQRKLTRKRGLSCIDTREIAHFRIASCLSFKASSGAQPFKWKLMQIKLISLTIVEHQDSL